MKHQQQTKIAQALNSQSQSNILTPKRLVSSLHQALWYSVNSSSIAKALLCSTIGILPLSLVSGVQASELDVYEDGSSTASGGGGPVITMMLDNSSVMGGPLTVQRGGRAILPTFRAPGQTYHALGINSLHKDYAQDYPECAEKPSSVAVSSPIPGNVNNKVYPSIHNYKKIGFTATIKQTNADKLISFELEACPLNAKDSQGNAQYKYTRLGRLKLGMVSLLADSIIINDGSNRELPVYKDIINGGFRVGLGQYPTPLGEAQTGNIVVPAGSLTVQHRIELIEKIVETKPLGLIPVAHAYAEAGAYMLGTKTATIETGERYIHIGSAYYSKNTWAYDRCVGLQNSARNNARINGELVSVYLCTQSSANTAPSTEAELSSLSDLVVTNSQVNSAILNNISGTPRKIYFKKITSWPSNNYSGMTASSADTKNSDGTQYISPISGGQECSANGIYFLSNGYPLDVFQSTAYSDRRLSALYPMNESLEEVLTNNTSEQVTMPSCNSGLEDENSGPVADGSVRGWTCIGEYAQKLNNKNLKKGALRTAFVGFGTEFRGISATDCDAAPNLNAKNACKLGSDAKATDGSYKYNYGQGGFYHVETPEEIANSFISFANKLKGEYKPQPNDGPSVSIDPTNSTDNRSFAYLPLLLPKPGTSQLIWEGNLKRYQIKDGTLFDARDKPLYNSINGQIDSDSINLWNSGVTVSTTVNDDGKLQTDINSAAAAADGSDILAAGAYAKLIGPDKNNLTSTRNVFVENKNGGSISKISVNGSIPAPQGFSGLNYELQRQLYLLNFLGYNVPVLGDKAPTSLPTDMTEYTPSSPVRVLGGINNGKPQEILYSYKKTKKESDKPTIEQTYKILYGSMDGALHLIDSDSGMEDFAFIPNEMVNSSRQVAAFIQGNEQAANPEKEASGPVFGVDAPWYVRTKYNRIDKFNADDKTAVTEINVNKIEKKDPSDPEPDQPYIKAYGGLGRGGLGFYGLNITPKQDPSTSKSKVIPELMFSINSSTDGFSRLARTWSKPVPAKVLYKENADAEAKEKDVLFVSGGYSLCYDIPEFVLNSSNADLLGKFEAAGKYHYLKSECVENTSEGEKTISAAKGNAVYMIDADSGKLLWSTSNTGTDTLTYTKNDELKHSIAASVGVIDKDNDGLADAIYFADLGGQLFRADFDSTVAIVNPDATSASTSTDTQYWAKRVVRVLNTAEANKPTLRFFNTPIVSLYQINDANESVKSGGKLHLIVTLASGDRNSPLAKLDERKYNAQPNKLINVWDADLPKGNWLALTDDELIAKDLTLNDLFELKWDTSGGGSSSAKGGLTPEQKTELNKQVIADPSTKKAKRGWYDNLTYFSGTNSEGNVIKSVNGKDDDTNVVGNKVDYLKVVSQPTLRAGRLFVPVYNRLAYIPAKDMCSPVPTGVSEAHEYCLPFGSCEGISSGVSSEGRGKSYVLGSGIGSITIASGEGDNRGYLLTPEQVKPERDPSDPEPKDVYEAIKDGFYSLYNLVPTKWFESTPEQSTSSSTDKKSED